MTIIGSATAGMAISLLIHRSHAKVREPASATVTIAPPMAQDVALPPEEIAKIQFEENAEAGPLSFYLANDSGWMISSFTIRVIVRNADGTLAYCRTIEMGDLGIEVYQLAPMAGAGLQRMWITGGASSRLLQAGQTLSRTMVAATGCAATPQFMERYDRANGYREHRDPQTGKRIVFDLSMRKWGQATK